MQQENTCPGEICGNDASPTGIAAVNMRLRHIHARLEETNYQLSTVNDRIYGPMPQSSAKAEAPMAVENTMSLLSMIEQQLDTAEILVCSF
jgi:hypothetical protein